MDSLDLNKACAAVLVAGIAFMGASLIGDGLVSPQRLAKSAYEPVMPETKKPAVANAEAPEPPVALLLASADPGRGEAGVKSQGCVACHSFNEGGKAGVGPNLYGVVGAPHGHMQGYSYSTALKSKEGPWTYAELSDWLRKPSAYAPGTKMSYAGLADPKKRADIIDYLRTLAANPEPLPAAPAQAAASQVSAAPTPAVPGAATTNAAPAGGAAATTAGTASPAGTNSTQSAAAPAGGVAPTGNQGVGGMGASTSKAP